MQVGTICSRHVVTVDAQRSLPEAARLMREEHVGTLVVTCPSTQGTEVCGIVTDRDLVIDAMARPQWEADVHVADVAHIHLHAISEHAELDEAVLVMQQNGVRRLLVSDSNDRLCGLLSMDDVIEAFSEQIGGLAKVIRSGKERETGKRLAPAKTALPRFPAMGTVAWTADPS